MHAEIKLEELQDFLNDYGPLMEDIRANARAAVADFMHKKQGSIDVVRVNELMDQVSWTFKVDAQ